MATRLRLARTGTKKRPHYRIVVADSRAPRDGRFIQQVGSYHPLLPKDHEDRVRLDVDLAKDWLSKGAEPTDRVSRILEGLGVLEPRERANPIKGKPKKRAQERAAALAAAEATRAEAETPAEASAPESAGESAADDDGSEATDPEESGAESPAVAEPAPEAEAEATS